MARSSISQMNANMLAQAGEQEASSSSSKVWNSDYPIFPTPINRKVLIYDADADTWTSIGEVPFDAPCGEALVLDGDRIYSINGEIKPGTRTKHMYSGILQMEE